MQEDKPNKKEGFSLPAPIAIASWFVVFPLAILGPVFSGLIAFVAAWHWFGFWWAVPCMIVAAILGITFRWLLA